MRRVILSAIAFFLYVAILAAAMVIPFAFHTWWIFVIIFLLIIINFSYYKHIYRYCTYFLTYDTNPWNNTWEQLPALKTVVETKVQVGNRETKICKLQLLIPDKPLWFKPNGKDYVLYTPTHWRYLD